jgi:hypothetical protein
MAVRDLRGKYETAAATGSGPTGDRRIDWGARRFMKPQLVANVADVLFDRPEGDDLARRDGPVQYKGAVIGLPQTVQGLW